ncbi:MAG: transposase [Planctomycetota bacterium]|jgi:putative transposase|nr:transposase [Planctomycetota bacterium]
MGRARRHAELGVPHHIAHRGNHKHKLFEDDTDRRYYLALLYRFSRLTATRIAGFCLMSNHVHVIAVPEAQNSLMECIGRTHRKFSEHLNRRTGTKGTNWEGRYFAQAMGPRHAVNALRYIERNPVDAGLIEDPTAWEWSSASAHSAAGKHWPILNFDVRGELANPALWRGKLGVPLEEEEIQELHWPAIAVSTGEVCFGAYR